MDKKRTMRTKEERIAAIDQKIAGLKTQIVSIEGRKESLIKDCEAKERRLQDRIKELVKRKDDLVNPKPKKKTKTQQYAEAFKALKKAYSPAELLEMIPEQEKNTEE